MTRLFITSGAFVALECLLSACAAQRVEPPPSLAAPTDAAPVDLESALALAHSQRLAGAYPQAAQTLSQLFLVAPDDARVLGEYGKTLIGQGRFADAGAFLSRAAELQPHDWTLFSARGVARDQMGEFAAAQDDFARALALRPDEPTVLNNSAMSHLQAGRPDEAERLLVRAAGSGSGPANPRIAQNLALVRGLKEHRQAQVEVAPAEEPVTVAAPALPAPPPVERASLVIGEPAPLPSPPMHGVFVQAGAFASRENADRLALKLSDLNARIVPVTRDGRTLHRVRIGPFSTAAEAEAALTRAESMGQSGFRILSE